MTGKRRLEAGPGFVRARECPDCGHTRCSEDCVCNCDAARAEHEAARLRVAVENLRAALSSVRDAALEEVLAIVEQEGNGNARGWLVPRIRALQSQPATVLSAEKVREVLKQRLAHFSGPPETERTGAAAGVVRLIAQDLGVELAATPECDCGHTSVATNNLCMAPVLTPGGSIASCGCSHESHHMPAPTGPLGCCPLYGTPHESCRHE